MSRMMDCSLGKMPTTSARRFTSVDSTNKSPQIPQDKHRYHYVKTAVRVHEHPDGGLAIFHGPRRLASYGQTGELKNKKPKVAA